METDIVEGNLKIFQTPGPHSSFMVLREQTLDKYMAKQKNLRRLVIAR